MDDIRYQLKCDIRLPVEELEKVLPKEYSRLKSEILTLERRIKYLEDEIKDVRMLATSGGKI